jgi:hypothetical protein
MINAEITHLARAVKAMKIRNVRADSVAAAATDKTKVVKVAAAVNNSKVVAKVIKAIATWSNTSFMVNNN